MCKLALTRTSSNAHGEALAKNVRTGGGSNSMIAYGALCAIAGALKTVARKRDASTNTYEDDAKAYQEVI